MEPTTLHEGKEANMAVEATHTAGLSKLLGVSISRIVWAHRTGKLAEPGRIGPHRAYGPEDIEEARAYFARVDAARRKADKDEPQEAR
jgi:hypothetical protein